MSEIIERLNAALLGRYRIDRVLGAGGMATVYLAYDLRHARTVAVKVLNPELGVRLGTERFLSEIRVTASLQHPHLLPLFDSGVAGDLLFYVMPYIEGGSLRDRLNRERHLPVDDAVRLTVGIAQALHYAHRQGIVHRDLKPENILLHEGQPLVADFGIALAVTRAGGERLTQTGYSLGTPQYCSPEQASGDGTIDGRSDVFALGAMLYEMLAGDPPHNAPTLQGVITRILTERPRDVRSLRPTCPEHVAAAVQLSLEKLAADRFASAQEFAEAVQGRDSNRRYAAVSSPVPVVAPPLAASRHKRWLMATVGLTCALVGAAATRWASADANAAPAVSARFPLDIAEDEFANTGSIGVPFALSTDGQQLVYLASRVDGVTQLRHRGLNTLQSRALTGTTGALHPAFDPTGRSIVFVRSDRVMRLDLVTDRPPLAIASLRDTVHGAAWGDKVVFGRSRGGLLQLASSGGDPEPLTETDTSVGEVSHRWPVLLGDGRTVLFSVWRGKRSTSTIASVDITTGKVQRFDIRASAPLGFLDGHLVVADSTGRIVAIPFDLADGRAKGAPLVGDFCNVSIPGAPKAALSPGGTLITYQLFAQPAEVVLVDTAGRVRSAFRQQRERFRDPRFSPDGRKVAVTVSSDTGSEIMLVSLATGERERLAAQPGTKRRPEWTADARRIVYQLRSAGRSEIWQRDADRGRPPEVLIPDSSDAAEAVPTAVSSGLFYRSDSESRLGIAVWWLDTLAHRAVPMASGQQPSASPDGRRVVFAARENGIFEVFLAGVPTLGSLTARCQISDGGGTEPAWDRTGRVVYYRQGYQVIRATLEEAQGCPRIRRRVLFELPMLFDEFHRQFDPAPDGSGFVMLREYRHESGTSIVTNWLE